MFNFRRSMNPPRRSTTSPPTSETPPIPTQDPPPLPPGPPPSHSHSESGSHTSPSHKSDPYHHHLQQSQSKIPGREIGTKKYPPPIENKPVTPKRNTTAASGIIGRVSSLFASPSSSGGGTLSVNGSNLTVPNTTTPQNAAENGRDDRSMTPSSKSPRKSLVAKFTKSSPKKSKSISSPSPATSTPTKSKRVPPPLVMTSSSPSSFAQASSSFRPFRSLTRTRSKLAQHLLGSLNEPAGAGLESLSSLHPSRSPRSPRFPRSPRSPRTPRSPFFYNAESDAESDIRRPSGLGRRVSSCSLPPSPFGATYPWEAQPADQEDGPESTAESETGKVNDEVPDSDVQAPKSDVVEGKGTLKETFRFPNKSVVNLIADNDREANGSSSTNNNGNQRIGGRVRALSSPGLLLSIGRKVREKLERERELGKLKLQLSNIQKLNEAVKRDPSPSNEAQDIQNVQDDIQTPKVVPDVQSGVDMHAVATSLLQQLDLDPSQELHRASVYSTDSELGSCRERMMSFSLVHEFPEPPCTHPSAHPSRHPSMSEHGAFMVLPPPLPSLPVSEFPLKRSSSSTMDSLASATASTTTTATSLGFDGVGSICNAVRGRVESYSPREIVVIPTTKSLTPILLKDDSASTPCTLHPQHHLPHEVLRLALSYLPQRRDIAALARVSKVYVEVVRAFLYDTVDLDALAEAVDDEDESTMRTKKLLATLVKRNDLTPLVDRFICREWPEWFSPSPYDLSQFEGCGSDMMVDEDAQEIELQNTFLASTLVLAVSRMTGLKELVLPSYHPFMLSPETRWSGLRTVKFMNIVLGDEEVKDMFAWLENLSGLENLSFPQLVEKADVANKSSNGSISSIKTVSTTLSKRSSTCSKRSSVAHLVPNKRSSVGPGMLYTPVSLNFFTTENSAASGEQLPRLDPLAKYARSRAFLPNLKKLHASPTIVSLLAESYDKGEEGSIPEKEEEEERPRRPLEEVTINIDMTLYTGLRPTALVRGLHGIKRLGLKFGERVDRRTVEKVFVAAGAALGSRGLERLDVEFVGAWTVVTDESLYKIIDSVLPRYPDLQQLKLSYSKNGVRTNVTTLLPAEEARLGQWRKYCPNLVYVQLLSGSSWRRTSQLA